jgi:hypothetical protein
MYVEPEIKSSYYKTGIGRVLYDYVKKHRPFKIVEFGVLDGFSIICMGQGLRDIGGGKIHGYDLWEKYEYGHGQTRRRTQENINKYDLQTFIELKEADFNEWLSSEEIEEIDLLHIDINNDGDLLKKINNTLKLRPRIRCDILFEGGIKERDNCWWMQEYNKPKMLDHSDSYEILSHEFPGLSKILK